MNAASEMFFLKGFQKTKIDDIVKSLNISKGLAFYYFKTKDELIDAVINKLSNEAAQPCIKIANSGEDFPQKIARLMKHFLNFAAGSKEKFKVMISSDDLRILSRYREALFQKLSPYLIELIKEGVDGGNITNTDASNSLIIIFSGCTTFVAFNSNSPEFDFEQFMHSAVNLMEMAMGMKKGSIQNIIDKI